MIPKTAKQAAELIARIDAENPIPADFETRGSRQTVVSLWPESGENKARFLDRCETALSKCIGPNKARRVCNTKWRKSEKLGKKDANGMFFITRGLDDTDTVEACSKGCLACKGRDAPFDPERDR
jgi:hypothetical protein